MGKQKKEIKRKTNKNGLSEEQTHALQIWLDERSSALGTLTQTFKACYNAIALGKATDEDFARLNNMGEEIAEIYQQLYDQKDKCAQSKPHYSQWLKLEIRNIILGVKLGLATINPRSGTYFTIIEESERAISRLKHYFDDLDFRGDDDFQSDIHLIFDTLLEFINSHLVTDKELKVTALAVLAKAFADKCDNPFIKLYATFFFLSSHHPKGQLNIFFLPPDQRVDFLAQYQKFVGTLSASDKIDDVLKYMQLSLIAYKFENYTRPHSIFKLHQIAIEEEFVDEVLPRCTASQFTHQLKLITELRTAYIEPLTQVLLKMNWRDILENASQQQILDTSLHNWQNFINVQVKMLSKWLTLFKKTVAAHEINLRLLKSTGDHSLTHQIDEELLNLAKNNDFIRAVKTELLRLKITQLKLNEAYNNRVIIDADHTHDRLIDTGNASEAIHEEISRLHQEAQNEYRKQFELSENTSKTLLAWENAQQEREARRRMKNKRPDAISSTSPSGQVNAAKPIHSDDEITVTEIKAEKLTPAEHHLANARQHYMLRDLDLAIQGYRDAATLAADNNQMMLLAQALDGEAFLRAHLLLEKANRIYASITSRLTERAIFSANQRDVISTQIYQLEADFRYFVGLNQHYIDVSQHPDILSNTESSTASKMGREHINTIIEDVSSQIEKIHAQYTALRDSIKAERYRFIMELGRKSARLAGTESTLSDQQIHELGMAEFALIGKGKKKHDDKSQQSKEYHFIIELDKPIRQLDAVNQQIQDISNLSCNIKFPMSEHAKSGFEIMSKLPGDSLLTGSTLTLSLIGVTIPANTDLDFIISCDNPDILLQQGFHAVPNIPHLYTCRTHQPSIDALRCPSDSNKSITAQWLIKATHSRDFTICKLAGGKDGTVYDASNGSALADLHNRVLRFDCDAASALADDPIRLLRAVKYMTYGFTPDARLHQALEQWRHYDNLNHGHLIAVARKDLSHCNRLAYVSYLQQYGLLKKLFGIRNDTPTEVAVWILEKNLSLKPIKLGIHTTFVSTYHDLSRLTRNEPRLGGYAEDIKSTLEERRLAMDALDLHNQSQQIRR